MPKQLYTLAARTQLTSEQLLTLHNTPVVLVQSPGSGKVLIPHLAVFSYRHGTVAYPASAMRIRWGIGGPEWLSSVEALSTVDLILAKYDVTDGNGLSKDTATIVNQPLVLDNAGDLGGTGAIAGIEVSSAIVNAGTGYAVNDTATITGAAGGDTATVTIDAVGGAGEITAISVTVAGAGYAQGAYTLTNVIGTGVSALVRITHAAGAVTDVELLTGSGAGYAVNDTGDLLGGTGGTYEVDAVGDFGEVTAVTLTAAGSGYETGNSSSGGESGAGTNLTINITSITAGDGTLAVTLYYSILEVP